MSANNALGSCTSIIVRNLSEDVDERFLELYFRSRLDPPLCKVRLLSNTRFSPPKNHAYIDLGSHEKVQQAIRELNGNGISEQHISVSPALRAFYVSPGMKVYLRRFPPGMSNPSLYDWLSKFGTVIGIELTYHRAKKHQLYSACVTYFTEKQAQYAIQAINNQNENSIVAEPDNRFRSGCRNPNADRDETEIDESYDDYQEVDGPSSRSSSLQTSYAVYEGVHWESEIDGEIMSIPKVYPLKPYPIHRTPIIGLTEPVLPPVNVQAALDLSIYETEEERKQAVCDLLLGLYKNDYKPLLHLAKILKVLEDSLDASHMLAHCTEAAKFRYYAACAETPLEREGWKIKQLSEEAILIVEDLQLSTMPSKEHQLQAIRKEIYSLAMERYAQDTLDNILDVALNRLDTNELLEVCANSQLLRLIMLFAKVELEIGSRLPDWDLSEEIAAFVSDLNLDTLNTMAERALAIRSFLHKKHQNRYAKERLAKILDKFFEPAENFGFLDILRICEADTNVFVAYAILAEYAMEKQARFMENIESDYLQHPIQQKKPSNFLDGGKKRFPIRDFLLNKHSERYGRERLNKILDKVSDSLQWDTGNHQLLNICASNAAEFSIYATAAEIAIETESHFLRNPISDSVVNLVTQLGLAKLETLAEWKKALRKHLQEKYQDQYGVQRLQSILDKIFQSLQSQLGFYQLLNICAVGEEQFCVYAAVAEAAVEQERDFSYLDLSNSVVGLVRELGLNKLQSMKERKGALRDYLLRKHRDNFESERLEKTIDKIFWMKNSLTFYELLNICTADSKRFRIYALYAEYAIQEGRVFLRNPISDSVVNLVTQLELATLETLAEWKKALRKHLQEKHQDRFGVQRLQSILDKIFQSLPWQSGIYQLFNICTADAKRFSVYAAVAEIANEITRDFSVHYYLSESIVDQVQHLDLDKSATIGEVKRALWNRLFEMYWVQYGSKELVEILDKVLLDAFSNPWSFSTLLQVCAGDIHLSRAFPIPPRYVNKRVIHFPLRRLMDPMVALFSQLNMEGFENVDGRMIALRNFVQDKHRERYESGRLSKVLDKIFDPSNCLDLYDLLRICVADSDVFAAYVILAEHAIEKGTTFFLHGLSESMVDLIQQLELCKLDTKTERDLAFRNYLVFKHKEIYESGRLSKVLDKIFDPSNCLDLYDLLRICVADSNAFAAYVILAEHAIEKGTTFFLHGLSESMVGLIQQLELCKLSSTKDRKSRLREYLSEKYQYLFEEYAKLPNELEDHQLSIFLRVAGKQPREILGKMFECSESLVGMYELLDLCTSDSKRFVAYANFALTAIKEDFIFCRRSLSDCSLELLVELNLTQLINEADHLEAFKSHLLEKHRKWFADGYLEAILKTIRSDMINFRNPYLYYHLLDLCQASNNHFCAYAVAADICRSGNFAFVYRILPDSVVNLLEEMDLEKQKLTSYRTQLLREHFFRKHMERFGTERMEEQLYPFFLDCMSDVLGIYNLLDLCASDTKHFRYYTSPL